MSNRFGERKDSPLRLVLVLLVVAFSSVIIVSVTLLLPPRWKKETARPLSWLLRFLFPQDESDDADDTEESDEEEEDDIRPVVTAMDLSKSFLVPIIAFVVGLIAVFIVVVDGFDVAAPSRKSNNSPKPVMGDQLSHSIFFPLPPNREKEDAVFWVSVDVLEDWDRAN